VLWHLRVPALNCLLPPVPALDKLSPVAGAINKQFSAGIILRDRLQGTNNFFFAFKLVPIFF